MDQLTDAMASKINLTREEENLVPLRTQGGPSRAQDYNLSLVGRVMVDKELSLVFIKNNVMRLLNPVKGAEIRSLASNLFLIRFNHRVDRKNAIEGCPWSLDRHALLFAEVNPSVPLAEQVVQEMRIVVRVHDYPYSDHTEEDAQAIGGNFGRYLGVLKGGNPSISKVLRVKVIIDVTAPLKRGFFALNAGGEKEWFHVPYERLPLFCFLCGLIGHGEVKCPSRFEEDFVDPVGELPYGIWLRATSDRPPTNNTRLPLQAVGSRPSLNLQPMNEVRRGGNIFELQKENRPALRLNENIRNLSGDSCGDTGSSVGASRRHVVVPNSKRKFPHITSPTKGPGSEKKKLHLALRDEDDISTAATAQQSRRS